MKKFLNYVMYTSLLVSTLSLGSCQKEHEEVDQVNEQETLMASSATAKLIEQTVSNDGSYDNIVDGSSCFDIQFPYKVNVNGLELTIDSMEDLELIGPMVPPTDLLLRLFHEENPRVFDAQTVRFGCTCSEERVRESLSIYSARDIATMTTDEGRVTADCQFCGRHYDLDPNTVGFEADGDEDDRH